MSSLAHHRRGTGPPLVLLHALGLSRAAWDPVVDVLAERFDVLAVDLPGHGGSAPVPPDVEAHPAWLAAAVADLLDELRIDRPHVAGNSLGCWVAVELAGLRPLASLTLLGPAGLWRRGTPLYCLASLRLTRYACRHAAGVLSRLVTHRLGRVLVLGQAHGRPGRVTPEQARAEIWSMGTAQGFDAALAATVHRSCTARRDLGAPVTVAFGSRDRILLRHRSRHLDQLPPGTRAVRLPGCGHIPMADDPPVVAALIAASAAAAEVRSRAGRAARTTAG